MAEKLDANNKRVNNERIFPRCGRKIKDETTTTQNFTAIVSGHGKSDTTYVVSI